jgi:predicted aspartyl protease
VNVKKALGASLIGTMLFSSGAEGAEKHMNSTPSADSRQMLESVIPVAVYNGFLVVVSGQIGGRKQNFIVDTGTAPSILNARLAKKMGLRVTETTLMAIGRSVKTGNAVVPDLELGPIRAKELFMNVMDLSQWEKNIGIELAGILGMDVLGRASFRLDYEKKELIFGTVGEEGIAVGYNPMTGLALAEAIVQGRRVRLIVDTGSDLVVVYGENWGDSPRAVIATRDGRSVAGQVAARPILKPEMELGGKQFHGLRTYCVPSAAGAGYDGFFGVRALKLRGITFDRESQTVRLLN